MIISGFNLIFINRTHISITRDIIALTHTVLKPITSPVNTVQRASLEGNRCHNYALTKHISHLTVLSVLGNLSAQQC